jgi:hypothetical protein
VIRTPCPFGAAVFGTAGLPIAHTLRMERRPGLEPGKTGFAIPRLDHFGIRRKLFGGGPEIRTLRYRVWNPVLSQSSLSPVVRLAGFEPALYRFESAASAVGLQAHGTRGGI